MVIKWICIENSSQKWIKYFSLYWKGNFMNKVPESIRKELAALTDMPESEIDFSDLPATTGRDWQIIKAV
jgi:hypothetical protein